MGDQQMHGKLSPFLHCLIKRAGISAFAVDLSQHGLCWLSTCTIAVIKATLHSPDRGNLRCIVIVYLYITNQTSRSCNILLCCVSPYCVPCIFRDICLLLFYANFQRFISKKFCSRPKRKTVLSKSKKKNPTSMNILPVSMTSHFLYEIFTYLKNTLFHA